MHDGPKLSAETEFGNQGRRDKAEGASLDELIPNENNAPKRVNHVWIGLILLCVYIFIATYTITPATLFRNATVKLPIFNADLPLKVYFVMAPILILAVHGYLVILTKNLCDVTGERAVGARLDDSIIVGSMSTRHRRTYPGMEIANGVIADLTMTVLPLALLLLIQLIFLPYQDEGMSWWHRILVLADVVLCLWYLYPGGRLFFFGLVLFAAVTSVLFAAFPGEWIYRMGLREHWPHAVTVKMFQGTSDPIDYVNRGGVLPFSNRLILPDDPKLADIPGAPSDGISLSVRGRNFRNAVFDRSNLARVDFSAGDLEGASLRGARLEGAKFECAGMVTYRGPAGAVEFTYSEATVCANLQNTSLAFARLDGASFEYAEMSGSDLSSTIITRATFSKSVLLGARFTGAVGREPKFSRARLIAADFSGAQLFASDFEDSSLQGANLSYSYLQGGNFRGSRMHGVDASGASLQGASFEETHLHAAKFAEAAIQGTSFKGAALPKASFTCATFFRSNFQNANRDQAVVTAEECTTGWTDYGYGYKLEDPIDLSYRLQGDALPTNSESNRSGYDFEPYSVGVVAELMRPQDLDDKTFGEILSKSTSDLSDITKLRVNEALETLRPSARTKAQDDADKVFRADWAKRSAQPESHEEALAERLTSIACVAEGGPHVARGLLQAKRFHLISLYKENNEREGRKALERLKSASNGGDPTCPGAVGLNQADFRPDPSPQ
jgi:uncharacterized protein YjbI with pentapeptide repeats